MVMPLVFLHTHTHTHTHTFHLCVYPLHLLQTHTLPGTHLREDTAGNIYYFNFATGASTWEHPCDEFYRKQLQQEREKKQRGKGAIGQGGTAGGSKKKKKAGSKTAAHPAAGKAGLNKMGMPPKAAQVSVRTHTRSNFKAKAKLYRMVYSALYSLKCGGVLMWRHCAV